MVRTSPPLRTSGRARSKLVQSTTSLLDEREPAQIAITDIAARAGVTRPTFYACFDDLAGAFVAAARARLEGVFEGVTLAVDMPAGERAEAMESAFVVLLERVEAHAEFFRRVLRGPSGPGVFEQIVLLLAERLRVNSPISPSLAHGPIPTRIAASALAAGVTWTIQSWLDEPALLEVRPLAALLRDFILRAVVGGLGGEDAVIDRQENPS